MKLNSTAALAFLLALALLTLTACSDNNIVASSLVPNGPQSSQGTPHESGTSDETASLSTLEESEADIPVLTENNAFVFSEMYNAVTDETILGVKIFSRQLGKDDLIADAVDFYSFQDIGIYHYIVPRYAGSSIVIESIDFDEARNEFIPTGILFEATATDSYVLLLQADLSEGGPRVRVTVSIDGQSASYEPLYDGRGDTVYPVVKDGVVLTEEKTTIPTELPGTSILADFQRPGYLHYAISNTVYDEEAETYTILYAVSNYDGDKDWQTYNNDNSVLHIQLFDKQGDFLRKIETELNPVNASEKIVPSEPCVFKDGMLTFFADNYPDYYVFFDIENETYTEIPAERCTTDGDYFLFDNGGVTRNGYTREYVYSLYYKDTPIASISIAIDDNGMVYPDNRYYEGELDDVFSLDSQNKTAIIGNDKLTYYLDFNTGTWRMERHYNRDHLEELLATSPDGRWEIYLADSGGAGDGFWADLVAVDTSSGEIAYLTDGYKNLSVAVTTDNLLLYNKISSLELIDIEKREILNAEFAIDCEAKDCYVNGVGYDSERDWFLVAWRSPQQGINNDQLTELPLMLDIYSRDGTLVKSMDTGYMVRPFHINWVIEFNLIPDGNGSADIIDIFELEGEKVFGTVKYD